MLPSTPFLGLVTGSIKRSSRDKLYQKLGLEYLKQKRWIRRLCLLHKFLPARKPSHIRYLLPQMRNSYRHPNAFHFFSRRTECFKRLFFIYMSFMNGKNLIQSSVTLVAIYFVMQCRNS